MGRILVVIPDDLEAELRGYIDKKFKTKGKKQGFLSFCVTEAIEQYLESKKDG